MENKGNNYIIMQQPATWNIILYLLGITATLATYTDTCALWVKTEMNSFSTTTLSVTPVVELAKNEDNNPPISIITGTILDIMTIYQSIEMIKTTVADHNNLLKIKTKINVEAKKCRPFPHIFHVTYSTTVASPTIY
ncbi:unnamed protein product [Rotaria sordida]|uniref:Uncharacterized protein n=1 Tax=Rotaria sordida TaxID=392033 RepID=A0A813V454_9BILA|nr:unnamed protein product [Rotaria sordida]